MSSISEITVTGAVTWVNIYYISNIASKINNKINNKFIEETYFARPVTQPGRDGRNVKIEDRINIDMVILSILLNDILNNIFAITQPCFLSLRTSRDILYLFSITDWNSAINLLVESQIQNITLYLSYTKLVYYLHLPAEYIRYRE